MLLIGLSAKGVIHGVGGPARRVGDRTPARRADGGIGLGDAGTGGVRYRRVPRRVAHLVPVRADRVPAGRRPARAAAAGSAERGRRARRGLAPAAPLRRAPPRRRGPDRAAPAPRRPARAPAGRAGTPPPAGARGGLM